ncbi:toll-like receptor 2 [Lineus longissimus]|uniref:toll-like receptor 2 n=1 Tax=Lineus longissimus TaxID=88925 RepID=UPI00315C7C3C
MCVSVTVRMPLTAWVLLFVCGASSLAAYETRDEKPKECPKLNGCYCEFLRYSVNCHNITTLPNMPSWIKSAKLEGGGRSLSPAKYNLSPSMTSISFKDFKELDLRQFFISSSSMTHLFSLNGNTLVSLRGDVFHTLPRLHTLALQNNNFTGMSTELLRGLRLRKLVLTGSKLTVDYLAQSICQMDATELIWLDLSNNELKTMPDELVKCVPSVRFLKLSGNNFFKPGCLDSLSLLMPSRIVLDRCNITHSRTLQFIRGKRLTYASFRSNNLSTADAKTVLCYLNFQTVKHLFMSSNNIGDIDNDYFNCINASKRSSPIFELSDGNISTISPSAFRPFQLWDSVSINIHFNSVSNVSFLLGFRSVQMLDIGHNGLGHVPQFRLNGRCMEVYPRQLVLKANYISHLRANDFECLPKLQHLDLSNNMMVTLTSKALYALHSLIELDLSTNPLEHFEHESLPSNLRSLNLNKNFFRKNSVGEMEHLTKLEKLFLSCAGTTVLPNSTLATLKQLEISEWSFREDSIRQIISSLKNIEILSLQQSNIHHFPYQELMMLENLVTLDLSRNRISALDHKRIWKIPKLRKLNVASNNFECNCSMLPFSEWLRRPRPRIEIISLFNVKCASPSKYYNMALFNFDKDCRSLLPIILPSTLGPIGLLIAIVIFVTVRYRGYIRYGLMLIRARWRGYGSIEGCKFKWDAFVSFNGADYDWVYNQLKPKLEDEAGYRICLHHRDFTIGEFITDNIVKCIDRSRKTLLILSDDFAKSQWCQLELSVAQHKLFYDDRDVLILVKLNDVSPENITGTMQVVMRTKTFITWSDALAEQDLFWKQLILALKRPPGVELEELEAWENLNTSDDD